MKQISLVLLLMCSGLTAATIHVPADYPTIQEGIDAAADGDVVHVAAGEYVILESIDFNMLHDPGDPQSPPLKNITLRGDGPDATIIRLSNSSFVRTTSTVNFEAGETDASVIDGMTLTAGGIRCVDSFPRILNCRITGSNVPGISCGSGSSPEIVNCTVTRNLACGISCGSGSNPDIVNCTITGNLTKYNCGGIVCGSESSPRIVNCRITGNRGYACGGVYCETKSDVALVNCTISGNMATCDSCESAGGVLSPMDLFDSYSVAVSSCIIWNNKRLEAGDERDNNIRLPIVDIPGYPVDHVMVTFSSIEGSWIFTGEGNMNEDPGFIAPGYWRDGGTPEDLTDDTWVDGDYRLAADSPVMDMGTCEGAPAVDIEDNPRPSGDTCDMGAYEHVACDAGAAGPDCNDNGTPDECDIKRGVSSDWNRNGIPDECDIESGASRDCNENGVPDESDIARGFSQDCNRNGIPDECELSDGTGTDCNGNGRLDECDIADGTSLDSDRNGIPDECDIASDPGLDENGDGVLDKVLLCGTGTPPECAPGTEPEYLLGLRHGCGISGQPGETVEFDVFCQLAQSCFDEGEGRVSGFSVSIVSEGCRIVGATALPLGIDHFWNRAERIDPAKNDGKEGIWYGVVFRDIVLDPEDGPHLLFLLRVQMQMLESGECTTASLRYEEVVRSFGSPHPIQVTSEGNGYTPRLENLELEICPGQGGFVRGDANASGAIDLSDAIAILAFLFDNQDGKTPTCFKTADVNDSGVVDLADPIYMLGYLFNDQAEPPPPFEECGRDETEDALTCDAFGPCE